MNERQAERAAVFVDRDGTLVDERHYLSDPDEVELIDRAAAAIARLRSAGYAVVIVTNQSGIARGYYDLDDFQAVQRRVEEKLEAEGVRVDGVYYCPHHPDITGPCECRKPAVGLYRRAADDLSLALEMSYYVGDRLKDVVPAGELGGTGILVRTGYGAEEEPDAPEWVGVAADLPAAAEWIVDGR